MAESSVTCGTGGRFGLSVSFTAPEATGSEDAAPGTPPDILNTCPNFQRLYGPRGCVALIPIHSSR